MENEKQITFLKNQIEEAVDSLYKRRQGNKTKAFRIQIATTILSAVTTIILGLKIERLAEATRITALIISSFITIVSGVDAFYNHKRLWITYADTLNAIYSLRFDLDFRLLSDAAITSGELELFKNRYQSVLDVSNEKWMKLRADGSGSKK